MTFTISPVDALFPVSVVGESANTAVRQQAQEETNRRRREQAEAETPKADPPAAAAPPDPEFHPTTGMLLDVKA